MEKSTSLNHLKENRGCIKGFWFIFLFGWIAIAILIYSAYSINLTKNWTPTIAKVNNVKTESRGIGKRRTSHLLLNYNYEVNGNKYNGSRLGRSFSSTNQIHKVDNIGRIYSKLDYANKIQIYYNPKNLKESVVINQFTNQWFLYVWLVLFINVIIYALKFVIERRNKLYILLPIIIGLCWICQYLNKIGYVDTSSLITVIEKYESTDCKFAKRAFDENVYIEVNNYRMEKNDIKFNRNSTIQNINILESTNLSNNQFQTTAVVTFSYNGKKTIRFKLEHERVDECWFTFQNISVIR